MTCRMGDETAMETTDTYYPAREGTIDAGALRAAMKSVAPMFPDPDQQTKLQELLALPEAELMQFLREVCGQIPPEALANCVRSNIPAEMDAAEKENMFRNAMGVFCQLKG